MTGIRKGFLAKIFTGVVAKRLTLVETITHRSNQHEFQGVKPLRALFGEQDRKEIPTTFIWMTREQEAMSDLGFISWSNVRKGKARAAEYHLYYSSNSITEAMNVGDIAFIALKSDSEALVIVVPADSSMLQQLYWLFGIDYQQQLQVSQADDKKAATFVDFTDEAPTDLDFAARFILEELGIEFDIPESNRIDELLLKFPDDLPRTDEFARFARDTLFEKVSVLEAPDEALLAWLDHEEKLFRRHEYLRIEKRLPSFHTKEKIDVDGSTAFFKSIFNARMSRMGFSLEHHLEAIFSQAKLKYSRGKITERTSKPDFIFPGIAEYHDAGFSPQRLTMLASKSSLKDRWRQMTREADRIEYKHLFTLQPGISVQQTDEIRTQKVQLVIPRSIHGSYRQEQQTQLMDLSAFLSLVREREV
jgi:EcoRII C terminal